MKRIVSIISAAAVLFSFQSCEVEPTSLSGDSLPVKVTVAGHCRYVAKDKSGTSLDPEIVKVGTPVEILYGVPGADSKVEYAVKTVKVNNEGYFETEIGCPVGKSLSVKVQASFKGECYAKDSKKVPTRWLRQSSSEQSQRAFPPAMRVILTSSSILTHISNRKISSSRKSSSWRVENSASEKKSK